MIARSRLPSFLHLLPSICHPPSPSPASFVVCVSARISAKSNLSFPLKAPTQQVVVCEMGSAAPICPTCCYCLVSCEVGPRLSHSHPVRISRSRYISGFVRGATERGEATTTTKCDGDQRAIAIASRRSGGTLFGRRKQPTSVGRI